MATRIRAACAEERRAGKVSRGLPPPSLKIETRLRPIIDGGRRVRIDRRAGTRTRARRAQPPVTESSRARNPSGSMPSMGVALARARVSSVVERRENVTEHLRSRRVRIDERDLRFESRKGRGSRRPRVGRSRKEIRMPVILSGRILPSESCYSFIFSFPSPAC